MQLASVVMMALIGYCACSDKGFSSLPIYDVGGYGGSYTPQYSHVSYAPVYHTNSYEQPKYYSNYQKYMPVREYIPVRSVPFYGPTQAFYPAYSGSYGGGY